MVVKYLDNGELWDEANSWPITDGDMDMLIATHTPLTIIDTRTGEEISFDKIKADRAAFEKRQERKRKKNHHKNNDFDVIEFIKGGIDELSKGPVLFTIARKLSGF